MLMTAENLKPVERAILEALEASSGWMDRTQLAQAIGRPKSLHPTDLNALSRLESLGLVESHQVPRGIGAAKWEYRAKH